MTFVAWLRSQTDRPDPIGDFSRYYTTERRFPSNIARLHAVLSHVDRTCAPAHHPVMRKSAKLAHREWRNRERGNA
jgi:hypothetical protein